MIKNPEKIENYYVCSFQNFNVLKIKLFTYKSKCPGTH